jgi:hypothetical protein
MSNSFLIANMEVGLERDLEPWLLPDEAFPRLEDAYLFRGRLQRRRGYANLGRLCEESTQVLAVRLAAPQNLTGPLTLGGAVQIQPGSVVITDTVTTFTDDGNGTMVLTAGTGTGGPIDYFTGVIDVTFTGAVPAGPPNVTATFCLIQGRPVMGLRTRELTTINQEQLIGFDTDKANVYSNVADLFQDITFHKTTSNAFSWTGTNSDFFWTQNYANAFWATNGTNGFQNVVDATNPANGDGIRWYDGTGWINFLPQVNATDFLMGSVLIIPYRNRLVMLNTTEGTAFGASTNYRQRARWCQNGTPYYVAPVPSGYTGGTDASSWRSDQVGKGGFIDAPTSEQIISAEFIHDTLIVYFERSTWELAYTGDPVLPFIWKRINVELGAESSFSIVPFDRGLLGVGNYGIITANGNAVQRIDQKIPDEVFNIHNGNDGVKRVYGIRDFQQQLVYWTFPDDSSNPTFPTRVLVYDYLKGTYAIFKDSLTCFGQYQPFNDTTWADLNRSWASYPYSWQDAQLQSDFPLIVAGNQQGFVFKNYNSGPILNDPSLYLTAITQAVPGVVTSPNHNLAEGTIIRLVEIEGMTLAIVAEAEGNALAASTSFSGQFLNPPVAPSSVTVTIGANVFTDDGVGNLTGGGSINYSTGEFSVSFTALLADTPVTADYTKELNNGIFRVASPATNTFALQRLDNNGNFVDVDTSDLSAYVQAGQIQVRNSINILTKKFNPFVAVGDQIRLREIDFFVEYAPHLEFVTRVYLDENNFNFVQQIIVLPEAIDLAKIWYAAYYSTIGQFAQIEVTFSNDQMFDRQKAATDLTIHAFLMFMEKAGRLTYGKVT